MEMHQIRYFLAVARTLNFTHAAEACHVAQPSLSQAIKKLEEELGGLLFRRERSLTHLTDLGRMVLPLLTQCYESALAAKDLATSIRKGSVAPLRLGLSHTINIEILVAPLSELVKAFQGLELSFYRGTVEEVAQRLKDGESELAIAGPLREAWERFDAYPLFTEGYQLTVSKGHPYAMRNALPFRSLPASGCWRAATASRRWNSPTSLPPTESGSVPATTSPPIRTWRRCSMPISG
jgi:DNA-binding transcriptional LysR family regulator